MHHRLPLDQHVAGGPSIGGDEGLSKKIVHPFVGHVYCLWSNDPTCLLVQPLGTNVQDHLLHVLRCQADKDAEEEVSLNLLLVLQRPFCRHVISEERQLVGLWPHPGNAELWPQR